MANAARPGPGRYSSPPAPPEPPRVTPRRLHRNAGRQRSTPRTATAPGRNTSGRAYPARARRRALESAGRRPRGPPAQMYAGSPAEARRLRGRVRGGGRRARSDGGVKPRQLGGWLAVREGRPAGRGPGTPGRCGGAARARGPFLPGRLGPDHALRAGTRCGPARAAGRHASRAPEEAVRAARGAGGSGARRRPAVRPAPGAAGGGGGTSAPAANRGPAAGRRASGPGPG